jgi:hypothetical protein
MAIATLPTTFPKTATSHLGQMPETAVLTNASAAEHCSTSDGTGPLVRLRPPLLREVFARFARRNTRSTETEIGGPDDGNAHPRIDVFDVSSIDFGVGFLPLLGKQGGNFYRTSGKLSIVVFKHLTFGSHIATFSGVKTFRV